MIVRQVPAHEWQTARTARLLALAGSPPGIFSTLLEEAQTWDDAHWRQWFATRAMFVAEDSSEVVGCAGGFHEEGIPLLVTMFVAPRARGTGVSAQLIEAVSEWARAAGHTELRLWVMEGNTPAEKLYRRTGFTATGDTRDTKGPHSAPEYRMSRTLR